MPNQSLVGQIETRLFRMWLQKSTVLSKTCSSLLKQKGNGIRNSRNTRKRSGLLKRQSNSNKQRNRDSFFSAQRETAMSFHVYSSQKEKQIVVLFTQNSRERITAPGRNRMARRK